MPRKCSSKETFTKNGFGELLIRRIEDERAKMVTSITRNPSKKEVAIFYELWLILLYTLTEL